MRKKAIVRSLLAALFLGSLLVGHSACGGGGNSSPTSPIMSGTPTPAPPVPTPRY